MSKIDVILPTYNHEAFLKRAINGILNQEFTDFSLIIVNDGSTDWTKSILDGIKGTDPRITIIEHEKNKGLPVALNTGHRAGTSPYCTWVSSDNVSYPKHLKELYECITEGDYDFVQGKWIVIKENAPIEYTDVNVYNKNNWGYNNLGPCFLYKRMVWETYKYDENSQTAEDLKFYLQAFTHPFKFGYTNKDYLLEYYIQKNSLTFRGNPKRSHQEIKNEIYNTVIKPKLGNK